ncbi:VRR-NUC domain-containing protein [Pseudomonas sp. ODNR1LW]|nr:VRR-NUC domain-containing protein [Pseudomonas sp. ODNR1LW]
MAISVKPRRAPTKRPEEDLQKVVVRFLKLAAPKAVFFHVPNQRGTRKRFEQELLKAMGVRAGVADLVFVLPEGRVAFLELKAPDNPRQSTDQAQFEEDVRALGAPYLICRSLAEVEGALRAWGVPLRGRSCE